MSFLNARVRRLLSLGVVVGLAGAPGVILAASPADCEAYARRAEADAGSMGGGMARGAARGAVFGAIVGDGSRGTKRGAALGAVAGGARNSAAKNDIYRRAYDDCMAGRVRY